MTRTCPTCEYFSVEDKFSEWDGKKYYISYACLHTKHDQYFPLHPIINYDVVCENFKTALRIRISELTTKIKKRILH